MESWRRSMEGEIPGTAPIADLPAGLDGWLIDFIAAAVAETDVLRANGAEPQVAARTRLVEQLIRDAWTWLHSEVAVANAAKILGRSEETVRRAIRKGDLPSQRAEGAGPHRVLRGDVINLESGRKKRYDPSADAQDIARLRSSR
jgi:hypothetical protein